MSADSKQEPLKDDQVPGENPAFAERVELAAEMEQVLHLYERGLEYC